MFSILKTFFWIILGIIMLYIIVVVFRVLFLTTLSTGKTAWDNTSFKNFSIQNMLNNFHPFAAAPINVIPTNTGGYMYDRTHQFQSDGGANTIETFDKRWGGYYENTYGQNTNSQIYLDNQNGQMPTVYGSPGINYNSNTNGYSGSIYRSNLQMLFPTSVLNNYKSNDRSKVYYTNYPDQNVNNYYNQYNQNYQQ